MGLTSHLSDACDAFSSSCFSFSSLFSLMKMSLTNMTMKVLGPVHIRFMLFFIFLKNSVGRVSSSESVGCMSISKPGNRVIRIFSVCRISGILKNGQTRELM